MNSERIVLLPLDGSKASLNALLPAKSIAILLNMNIHILYISEEKLTREQILQKLQIQEENNLQKFIISHKKGDPAEVIIEEGKNANYIVMGSHGQGYDPSKLAGSVAIKVIENSAPPVLLVKPDILLTCENNLWQPKNALIPLNGTPCASPALGPAMDILTKTNAELDLLHISVSAVGKESEGVFTVPYYEDYPQHEWPFWTKEFLRRFGPALKNQVNIEFFVSTGDPADEIIKFVKEKGNDLIAIAWHGNLIPPHATTLRKIMFEAPCPILLVKISHKK